MIIFSDGEIGKPFTVKTIANGLLSSCINFTMVTFPLSTTTIYEYALTHKISKEETNNITSSDYVQKVFSNNFGLIKQ